MIELLNSVWGALLAAAALFGAGWGAHAWFHRREHDNLNRTNSELQTRIPDLERTADQEQSRLLQEGLNAMEPDDPDLTGEEMVVLSKVAGQPKSPNTRETRMSTKKVKIISGKLHSLGLIDYKEGKPAVTERGYDWMYRHNILK